MFTFRSQQEEKKKKLWKTCTTKCIENLFVGVTLCYAQWIAFSVNPVPLHVLPYIKTKKGERNLNCCNFRMFSRRQKTQLGGNSIFFLLLRLFISFHKFFCFILPLSVDHPQPLPLQERFTLKAVEIKSTFWAF